MPLVHKPSVSRFTNWQPMPGNMGALSTDAGRIAAIALRGAIIKQNLGEPKPEPRRNPNLKNWSAQLIGGKNMEMLGFAQAASEAVAIEPAVALFALDTTSVGAYQPVSS